MENRVMKTTTLKRLQQNAPSFAKMPRDYRALCCEVLLPRPLHTKTEYKSALAVVEAIAGHHLTKDQDDFLDAVTTFIEAWEEEHEPKPPEASPLEVLKNLLTENGLSGADLGKLLGVTTSMASRILSGERHLTTAHIVRLAARFKLEPQVFLPTRDVMVAEIKRRAGETRKRLVRLVPGAEFEQRTDALFEELGIKRKSHV
jgi:HTH-type transcriptional regulator / antitoxin HigA